MITNYDFYLKFIDFIRNFKVTKYYKKVNLDWNIMATLHSKRLLK